MLQGESGIAKSQPADLVQQIAGLGDLRSGSVSDTAAVMANPTAGVCSGPLLPSVKYTHGLVPQKNTN